MAVGDVFNYDHLCTRGLQTGCGCYCDSFSDVKRCPYATWEHKKHCYYSPDEQDLKERHRLNSPTPETVRREPD